jgi:hypothetical protein
MEKGEGSLMSDEEQLRRILETVRRIEKKVDNLPCVRDNGRFCPMNKPLKRGEHNGN